MVRPVGVAASTISSAAYRLADEREDRGFLHIVHRWHGDLPHAPRLWCDVCSLLAALGICATTGRHLRPVPGHEPPKGRGRPHTKG